LKINQALPDIQLKVSFSINACTHSVRHCFSQYQQKGVAEGHWIDNDPLGDPIVSHEKVFETLSNHSQMGQPISPELFDPQNLTSAPSAK
jgi:hypothetical protein